MKTSDFYYDLPEERIAQQELLSGKVDMLVAIVAYNRAKLPPLMGACRALNVLCGVAVCMGAAARAYETDADTIPLLLVAPAWYFYFTFLTRYSEGEELDEAKKRRVGALVGGIIWLQIAALAAMCLAFPAARATTKPLLVAAGCLLVALRLAKRLMPRVSAS